MVIKLRCSTGEERLHSSSLLHRFSSALALVSFALVSTGSLTRRRVCHTRSLLLLSTGHFYRGKVRRRPHARSILRSTSGRGRLDALASDLLSMVARYAAFARLALRCEPSHVRKRPDR